MYNQNESFHKKKENKMYRMIIFNEDGYITHKHKISMIMAGTKLLKVNESYIFNDTPFYVMQGSGAIEFELLPHTKPRFHKIQIENLDYFMQYEKHKSSDYEEREQIENFVRLYDINQTYGCIKLYNSSYNRIEQELSGISKHENRVPLTEYKEQIK